MAVVSRVCRARRNPAIRVPQWSALQASFADELPRPTLGCRCYPRGVHRECVTRKSSSDLSHRLLWRHFAENGPAKCDGRYYVVAVPPGTVMIGGFQAPDRGLMESLKKVATEVLLNAGEIRTVDLRVTRFEQ